VRITLSSAASGDAADAARVNDDALSSLEDDVDDARTCSMAARGIGTLAFIMAMWVVVASRRTGSGSDAA
jgi:hypothetical protein